MTEQPSHCPPSLPSDSRSLGNGRLISFIAGGSLLAYAMVLSVLSYVLQAGAITREHALVWLAAAGIAAGAVYLAALFRGHRQHLHLNFHWIVAVAIFARLVVCISPPMLESDYQRYLWDGAVVTNGINPYQHAPSDVIAGTLRAPEGERLADLARRAGPVLTSINHPALTTIYPPAAQGAFAAAYAIAPFSPVGLRIVFGLADAATLMLLSRLLKTLSLPASQVIWYAWNPLLLCAVYSSLHMDILVLPLIVASLLAAVRCKEGIAAAWLVIASAVKVWPVVLVPLVVRPMLGQWRQFVLTLTACAILGAALWLPVLLVSHGESSGFIAYGKGWQNNDGYFRAGIWLTERVLTVLSIEAWHSHAIMRITSAALLGGVVLWQMRSKPTDVIELIARCLFIVGAVFMLSPTQFPWYWLWCLPLLTLRPSLPLLLYVALLPIYYVQDQLAYPLGHWLQHAPVWILLFVAGGRTVIGRVRGTTRALEVSHA